MASNKPPPYYILFSNSSLSPAPSTTLGHPAIQYHYADDSLLSLLPQYPQEHVLLLDYDPSSSAPPAVKSISKNMSVTGLKIEDAPGVAAVDESGTKRVEKMFIIETTMLESKNADHEEKSPHAILAEFKHKNAILRRGLAYPETPKATNTTTLPPTRNSTLRPDV
ncbi:uncharacterized protein BT62DRAFT_927648 [Guyanagaster necrorhizus]|uniref:Uncharacterized protein n=1 Tax=Guyanagaster necrorhizus TaxID=856835 RepID=A0A9P8AW91_9AGAR|nr:uncharacterized protein BT62DRAFT_927648 [Guyanagaster necrorhizus MCA 3950]KAG7450333.1 hypothetical protein BT62DRAFT_927648 [Guyanagaster necrorhizus MCA 3950]